MNLSIAKRFVNQCSLMVSLFAGKLAPTGRYVATVNGTMAWNHVASDTGYSGDEWMSDMLLASDPFAMTEAERFSWSNAARYGGSWTPWAADYS